MVSVKHNNSISVHLCLLIVPAAVTNLRVTQSYPNDTNDTVVNVTIYWNEVSNFEMIIINNNYPLATSFISSSFTRICYLSKYHWCSDTT